MGVISAATINGASGPYAGDGYIHRGQPYPFLIKNDLGHAGSDNPDACRVLSRAGLKWIRLYALVAWQRRDAG